MSLLQDDKEKLIGNQKKLDKALKRNLEGQSKAVEPQAKAPASDLPVDDQVAVTDENIEE